MADEYVQRKYRVRKGVQRIIKYLEWRDLCNEQKEPEKHLLDEVIKKALFLIKENNIKIKVKKFRGRIPETFTLTKETCNILNSIRSTYRAYIGEMLEICLYIYSYYYLTEKELELNGLHKWDIVITEDKHC